MIKKILPILLTSLVGFTCRTSLPLKTTNKVSHTQNYNYGYDFIDYEFPTYRLGDYDITELEHISSGGGQVRYNRIQAVVPRVVFDTLGAYQNVFIVFPLYDYNSAVDLYMRIDWYSEGEYFDPASYDLELIPLSMTMLKVLPYTIVDLPYYFNIFDSNNWTYDYQTELRLTFTVPFTAHTNPPSDYANEMRNITLFTKRSDSAGYFDGYETGYNDGYENGNADGYADGYADGSADSYLDGYNEGYKWGDIDGYNRGINEDFNAYSYLFGMFGAFSGLFAVELLPGLTIGGIAILVLSLTLLPFLIGLFTKGGRK